jgi:NAD(P)-dependent dehydrogenase (short-subunit alcohol dehydrogenase family)
MEQPVIVVTGASQGLGAAIATIAAEKGAQVVLAARNSARLVAQAQKISYNGGRALVITADVSRFADCQRVIDLTLQTFGRIDALINNAAVIEPFVRISDISVEDWAHLLAVNLLGPVMMCQLAIPSLRQSRGRVINLTSHGADLAIPGAGAYSTSKAALNRFSKVLAAEEPDITVILFNPGEIDTPMQAVIREKSKGVAPDEVYQFFVDLHEQGKLVPPEIPAKAAVGLALAAPQEWSGEIMQWDDERVKGLEVKNE